MPTSGALTDMTSSTDIQTFPTALVGALVGVIIFFLLLLVLVGVVLAAVLWKVKGRMVRVWEGDDYRKYDDVVIENSEMIATRRNEAYGHLKRGEGGGERVRSEVTETEVEYEEILL